MISDRNTIELLLERGADVNVQGGVNGNALQAASVGGHKEIVELLLERGADVNAQGGYIWQCIASCIIRGHSEVVEASSGKRSRCECTGRIYGNAFKLHHIRVQ